MSEQPTTHPLSWYADCIRRGDDPLVVLEYVAGLSHAGGERAERERIAEQIKTEAIRRYDEQHVGFVMRHDREHVERVVQRDIKWALDVIRRRGGVAV